jgi:hypothetical protein
MKTFSAMSEPDLLLTREAYCYYSRKLKKDFEAKRLSGVEISDKEISKVQKELHRLDELIHAISMQFPKMTLAEFWEWRKRTT